jgi:translocator protein
LRFLISLMSLPILIKHNHFMNKSQIYKLILSLILTLGTGAIAGIFTGQSVSGWYATLNQPSFNPPNWIFGPVWSALYTLMGISLYLVWKMELSGERNRAILVFMVQLLLNFSWSFLFFYFQMPGAALIEIIFLWASILTMNILFFRIKPAASYLNIPYLMWVTFAAALNAAYYFLNRV